MSLYYIGGTHIDLLLEGLYWSDWIPIKYYFKKIIKKVVLMWDPFKTSILRVSIVDTLIIKWT